MSVYVSLPINVACLRTVRPEFDSSQGQGLVSLFPSTSCPVDIQRVLPGQPCTMHETDHSPSKKL
jgi:hypothetical protein